jgi:hypothetical protein
MFSQLVWNTKILKKSPLFVNINAKTVPNIAIKLTKPTNLTKFFKFFILCRYLSTKYLQVLHESKLISIFLMFFYDKY